MRAALRKWRYGISVEQFEVLRIEQRNRCKICRKEFDRTPCVDHNHLTGERRGLLCHKCNRGLGQFNDDAALLTAALTYLESYEKTKISPEACDQPDIPVP
jgi:hypothetical protein